jgi:tetratricopeptide (TPR) repeat protein
MQLVAKNVAIVPDVTMMAAEVHARLMLAAQQLAANNLPAAEYHCQVWCKAELHHSVRVRTCAERSCTQVAVWLRPDCVEGFLGLAGVLMRKARCSLCSLCKRSLTCTHQADVAGAHAVYAHAVRLRPASGAAWCGLAAAAAASGGGVDATLACFCEAVRVEPGCADAYVGLGSCMKEMGKLEEAEAHFAHAVRLRPCDARLHAFLAGILYERERLVECMHVYSAALQLDPCFAEVMNDMGNACRGLGRLEDAQCWYSACLAQHAATGNVAKPAVAIGHANLGAIHKLQNRPAEAAHCFDIAVRLQPENADAHAALGGTLKDVGQHELALASYRTALALRPDHAIRACFVHSLASVCSWDEFQAALAVLEAEVRALVAAGKATAVQPFHAVRFCVACGGFASVELADSCVCYCCFLSALRWAMRWTRSWCWA